MSEVTEKSLRCKASLSLLLKGGGDSKEVLSEKEGVYLYGDWGVKDNSTSPDSFQNIMNRKSKYVLDVKVNKVKKLLSEKQERIAKWHDIDWESWGDYLSSFGLTQHLYEGSQVPRVRGEGKVVVDEDKRSG
jgi:hypothetical protein